jgi:hypothetical protein
VAYEDYVPNGMFVVTTRSGGVLNRSEEVEEEQLFRRAAPHCCIVWGLPDTLSEYPQHINSSTRDLFQAVRFV